MNTSATLELETPAPVAFQPVVRSARLADGSIIPLLKDCGCGTHEGPHWLHMDSIDRDQNRSLLNGATSSAEIKAFMESEQRRLAEKLREMKARNIEEIL